MAGNYQTGHRSEPPPLALHPCSVTERAVHKLLTDQDAQQAQADQQATTIGDEVEFQDRIRRSEERRAM
jgi:hypothetical protein